MVKFADDCVSRINYHPLPKKKSNEANVGRSFFQKKSFWPTLLHNKIEVMQQLILKFVPEENCLLKMVENFLLEPGQGLSLLFEDFRDELHIFFSENLVTKFER